MKSLVVYDSVFGNTEKVALAIGEALGPRESVTTVKVSEVTPEHLAGAALLVVGSPTRAFRPTSAITRFVSSLAPGRLKGIAVAAFDTRMSVDDSTPGFLKFMVRLFGYAAEPIARKLQSKGGSPAASPAGFIVAGTEGPVKEGELERAARWAAGIAAAR